MRKSVFLVFLFLLVFSSNAFSIVKTWDGGGGDANWSTAGNWSDDITPETGDDIVFPVNAAQFTASNFFNPPRVFSSITFQGGNYTITGGIQRISEKITVLAGTHTFTCLHHAFDAMNIEVAAGASVTFGIVLISVEAAGVPFNLTLEGAGNIAIGVISGSGKIRKIGPGAALIAGQNMYTNGGITLNEGIMVVDANIPTTPITIDSSSTGGTLGFSGFGGTGTVGTVNVTQGAISAGTLTSPTGILNTGNLTFTANGNYAVKIGGATPGASGHDQLNVTGTVTLAGARLVPIPWNAFRPALGDSFVILRNDGADAINGTFLNAPEGATFGGALNTAFRISYIGGDGNDVTITRVNKALYDFDGDGKTDISIFRPATSNWWYKSSINNAQIATQWGAANDLLAPADFDGDNKTDVAVFRPSEGVWYILNSANGTANITQFGSNGDKPLPNDFDGDGRGDIAVFRPSNGVWYELRSLGNQVFIQQFGLNGDVPLLADYDGDGIGDLAVFRPNDGVWHYLQSSDGGYVAFPFGTTGDKPAPGDYDGDGRTDAAIFRATADPNQPDFYILLVGPLTFQGYSWGVPGDLPVVADYDGDAKTDVGVFRPATNDWFLLRSTAGFTSSNFGLSGDKAVPGAYVP